MHTQLAQLSVQSAHEHVAWVQVGHVQVTHAQLTQLSAQSPHRHVVHSS
ncbi:MAG: hypothetical protein ACFCUP_16405 [Actinomycetales bacterium]